MVEATARPASTASRQEIDGEAQLQLLNALIDQTPYMVFVKEARELHFVELNRAGEQLLGISREEMLGKNDFDLFPRDQANFFVEKDRAVLNGREGLRIDREPIETRDHGLRILRTQKMPMLDDNGEPAFLLGISSDITDQVREEERIHKQLDDTTAAYKEAVADLQAFTYAVSHDLRTPLRAMDGFSHMLLDRYGDMLDGDGRDTLQRIRGGAQRMGQLIDGLLTLARLSGAGPRREEVDTGKIAEEAAEEIRALWPEHPVDITIRPLPRVHADPKLLKDVFRNLLDNAWKFTRDTNPPVIEVGSKDSPDGEHEIFVRDNGAGFDQAYSEKIFGVFDRLHDMTDFDGYGIGLATVRRIIEMHDGHIWAKSRLGKGAVFSFTMGPPASRDTSAPD